MIECLDTGLVYRNPKPYLRAIHTWHPSLVRLTDGHFLASFDLGQGAESLDYRTYSSRSSDGQTWTAPVPLFEDTSSRRATHSLRIGRASDGTITAFGGRFYRDDPESGLTNRDNLGFVSMDLILLKSEDAGASWGAPRVIEPPLKGPAFETCHSIIELSDGRWLAPTSTWKSWKGDAPNGMKAVAFVSYDRGNSWPEYLDVMDRYREKIISWEQSLVELPDRRLLAVIWAFNEQSGHSEPTPYTIAADGKRFSAPQPTGWRGQTAKILSLGDNRILCLYRSDDRPGLWANLARIEGEKWINLEEAPIWRGAPSGMSGKATASDELGDLKFGYPTMALLPGGDVLALFWCCEECINNIRWVRIQVR